MAKRTKFQSFTFTDRNGNEHEIECFTTSTRYRTTEHAILDGDVEGKYYWENRPWQSYTYEEAILSIAKKLYKRKRTTPLGEDVEKFAKHEEIEVSKKCDAIASAFKSAYDAAPQSFKEKLAKDEVEVKSVEQAQALTGILQMAAIIG